MKQAQNTLSIRMIKGSNILMVTLPFLLCWFGFYETRLPSLWGLEENILLLLLFAGAYSLFARIYKAFQVSVKKVPEAIYSQTLAAILADGLIFVVNWLINYQMPPVLPMMRVLLLQIVLTVVWTAAAHKWYFNTFPPRKTAIVFAARPGMEKLIEYYSLERKYDVKMTLSPEECLANPQVLRSMDTVFLSGLACRERNMILKYCILHNIQVLLIPCIGDVILQGSAMTHLFHLPVLAVGQYAASPEYLLVKRLMDIFLSLTALLLLSPLMVLIALAIKLEDHGPIFYTQERLTRDGAVFRIYKFRSMRVDAEKDGVARLSTGENDDRITKVGRIIRKLRMDELPQLLNILQGTLSVCGPRPERPEIAAQYTEEMPEFDLRLQAKAGLTGYAQVYGQYNTSPYDKLLMDLIYIAHPSILMDLKIMLATIKVLFLPESTKGIEEGQITAQIQEAEEHV